MNQSKSVIDMVDVGEEVGQSAAKLHCIKRSKLQGVIVDPNITVILNHHIVAIGLRNKAKWAET